MIVEFVEKHQLIKQPYESQPLSVIYTIAAALACEKHYNRSLKMLRWLYKETRTPALQDWIHIVEKFQKHNGNFTIPNLNGKLLLDIRKMRPSI